MFCSEIINEIATHLDYYPDLANLSQVNRFVYQSLDDKIFQQFLEPKGVKLMLKDHPLRDLITEEMSSQEKINRLYNRDDGQYVKAMYDEEAFFQGVRPAGISFVGYSPLSILILNRERKQEQSTSYCSIL